MQSKKIQGAPTKFLEYHDRTETCYLSKAVTDLEAESEEQLGEADSLKSHLR